MGFGKIEIILLIVLVIILLFVGAKKLPELARGVGQSAKELKKGFSEGLTTEEDAKKKASTAEKKK
jgi:sec-independent protein translocase protein TatA